MGLLTLLWDRWRDFQRERRIAVYGRLAWRSAEADRPRQAMRWARDRQSEVNARSDAQLARMAKKSRLPTST
jgi:hypothetical protein